ncbi:7-carboxy-7-deazaguanine synthase [Caldinitratiruptor microaerophilus]|uniref:7-carboxy-7-deazaguanine synthase n=2 Tax=Caldinitratiruptor microaerophilus TaxID=671077 RepID=A0AA35GBB3_9FIRM|nr:7-carboxy-7-deazaguanine synthase [Caldinitratiruptor microaerophilus]
MRMTEIFLSLQGETSSVGLPTIFVRTNRCNLRCTYCDTTYAFYGGYSMSIDEIMDQIRSYGYKRVCLTGGEPLVQPREELQAFFDRLAEEGYELSVETGGSIDIGQWRLHRPRQRWIVDMKVPSSGESHRMCFQNLEQVAYPDEVKFVCGSEEDYLWSRHLIERYRLQGRAHILFGPVWGQLEPRLLAGWILRDRLDARLQLQIHKIIWDPAARGV